MHCIKTTWLELASAIASELATCIYNKDSRRRFYYVDFFLNGRQIIMCEIEHHRQHNTRQQHSKPANSRSHRHKKEKRSWLNPQIFYTFLRHINIPHPKRKGYRTINIWKMFCCSLMLFFGYFWIDYPSKIIVMFKTSLTSLPMEVEKRA